MQKEMSWNCFDMKCIWHRVIGFHVGPTTTTANTRTTTTKTLLPLLCPNFGTTKHCVRLISVCLNPEIVLI